MITGRKPSPTRLKILNGNPGKRAINRSEPQADPVENIIVPDHLSEPAKKEYKTTAELLQKCGLLTEIDMKALELYADAYGIWFDATEKIQKLGLVVKTNTGRPTQNPYLGIANTAVKRMQQLLPEFGMTPSARSRLKAEKPKKNEFDDV